MLNERDSLGQLWPVLVFGPKISQHVSVSPATLSWRRVLTFKRIKVFPCTVTFHNMLFLIVFPRGWNQTSGHKNAIYYYYSRPQRGIFISISFHIVWDYWSVFYCRPLIKVCMNPLLWIIANYSDSWIGGFLTELVLLPHWWLRRPLCLRRTQMQAAGPQSSHLSGHRQVSVDVDGVKRWEWIKWNDLQARPVCTQYVFVCTCVCALQCFDKSVIILLWDGDAKKDNSSVIQPSVKHNENLDNER